MALTYPYPLIFKRYPAVDPEQARLTEENKITVETLTKMQVLVRAETCQRRRSALFDYMCVLEARLAAKILGYA